MKKCNNPSCGREIPDESAFCLYCGTKWVPLKHKCPRCDFDDIPDNALFCPNCGLKLDEGRRSEDKKGGPALKVDHVEQNINVGDDKPEELASLKNKDKMLGDIVAQLKMPINNVVSALQTYAMEAGMNVGGKNQHHVIQHLVDNMVFVQGGTFDMGATSEQGSDAFNDEKPVHRVYLPSFYIGKYEVTQEEWVAVMGCNPSNAKGARRPVENVSWDDCQKFIKKLNAMTGKQFRLPTEAEWEYAARGGNKSNHYKYAGGNTPNSVAWCDLNSGSSTHPVGEKVPNELGLYDMSGNVWEWCSDWYGRYGFGIQNNPKGPSSGSNHVYRGGSWDSNPIFCRVSLRSSDAPSLRRSNDIGVRLAL